MPTYRDGGGKSFPLEPSPDEIRHLVDRAMQYMPAHIELLPDQPAANTEGGAELTRSLREPLPMSPAAAFSMPRWRT